MLLADVADANDQAVAMNGEQPHFRADLDQQLGMNRAEIAAQASADRGDNVIEMALWLEQTNNYMNG